MVFIEVIALLTIGTSFKYVAGAAVTNFDQRQEGKVNVQIDVKDVQIVALLDSDILDDYTNYDYAYDYADFTIKPSKPIRPPSTTSSTTQVTSSSFAGTSTPSTAITDESTTITADASSETLATTTSTSNDESSSSDTSFTVNTTTTQISPVASGSTEAEPQINATTIIFDENKVIVEGVSNANKIEEQKQHQMLQSALNANVSKPDETKRPLGIAEPRKRCPVGFLLKSGRCFKRRMSLISPRFALMKLAPTLLKQTKVLTKNIATQTS